MKEKKQAIKKTGKKEWNAPSIKVFLVRETEGLWKGSSDVGGMNAKS